MRLFPILACCLLVAACGGSAAGLGPPIPAGIPADRAETLDDLVEGLSILAFADDLPVTGRATYTGVAGLVAAPDTLATGRLVGSVRIRADFGNTTVEGAITGLAPPGATVPEGDIAIALSTLSRTGVDAPLAGDVTLSGTAFTVSGQLRGAILGPGQEGFAGAIDAALRRDGDAAGTLTGELWARRD